MGIRLQGCWDRKNRRFPPAAFARRKGTKIESIRPFFELLQSFIDEIVLYRRRGAAPRPLRQQRKEYHHQINKQMKNLLTRLFIRKYAPVRGRRDLSR